MNQTGIHRESLIAKQNACIGAATGPSNAGALDARSEMQQVFEEADATIGQLEFMIGELERKLSPLLRPSVAHEKDKPLINRNSEITQGLQMAVHRVSTSSNRVQDILSSLVL